MKSKAIMLLLVCLLLSFTITSSIKPVSASSNSNNSFKLAVDGGTINIDVLSQNINSTVMEYTTSLNGEIEKEIATIDYMKQKFTISDEDGNKETYFINDFIADLTDEDIEYVNENMPEDTVEGEIVNLNSFKTKIPSLKENKDNLIMPLANENTRSTFYPDIATATGISNGTWSKIASHSVSGKTIDVIQGVQWTDTTTLKKLQFTKGLALTIIVTTIVALSGGITTAAVLAALAGIGIDVSLAYLGSDVTIFAKVRQQDVGKGFYVQHEGFPTYTKKYYQYIYVLGENNKSKQELYCILQ